VSDPAIRPACRREECAVRPAGSREEGAWGMRAVGLACRRERRAWAMRAFRAFPPARPRGEAA
jgi:hypothetical protein